MTLLVSFLVIAVIYCAQLLNWAAVGYLLARLRSPFPDAGSGATILADGARTAQRMQQRSWLGRCFLFALPCLGVGALVAFAVAPSAVAQLKVIFQVALATSIFMSAHCVCCLSSLMVKLYEPFQKENTADGAILFFLKAERVRLLLWLASWLFWTVLFAVAAFLTM